MALAFNAEQRQKELKPIRMPRSFYRGGGRLLAPRSWSPPKIFRSVMRQFCGLRRKLFRILVLGAIISPCLINFTKCRPSANNATWFRKPK